MQKTELNKNKNGTPIYRGGCVICFKMGELTTSKLFRHSSGHKNIFEFILQFELDWNEDAGFKALKDDFGNIRCL